MDSYEKTGYVLLGFVAIVYILAMISGLLGAFPFGLIGLLMLIGVGALILKVVKERLENKEDDYYSKEVDK